MSNPTPSVANNRVPETLDLGSVPLKSVKSSVYANASVTYYSMLAGFTAGQYGGVWLIQTEIQPYLTPYMEERIALVVGISVLAFILLGYVTRGREWSNMGLFIRALTINVSLAAMLYFATFLVSAALIRNVLLNCVILLTTSALWCWLSNQLFHSVSLLVVIIVNLVSFTVVGIIQLPERFQTLLELGRLEHPSSNVIHSLLVLLGSLLLIIYVHLRFIYAVNHNQLNQREIPALACTVLSVVVISAIIEVYSITYLVVFRSRSNMLLAFVTVSGLVISYQLEMW
jgi:hypothetical protein